MNKQPSDIGKELEDLFKKTTQANKLFLTEGIKFVKQLSSADMKIEKITGQKEFLKNAVNLFVKLNIEHTSNLIDLGLSVAKQFNQNLNNEADKFTQPQNVQDNTRSAFVLNVSGAVGTILTTQFILESDKKDTVICNLKQTEYIYENDPTITKNFKTTFTPQSFQLSGGNSQVVEIAIIIATGTKEGIYISSVQVEGMEHTFFSICATITPPVNSSKKLKNERTSVKRSKK